MSQTERTYRDSMQDHDRSLDALVEGSIEVSESIANDARDGALALNYDLEGNAHEQFEQLLDVANYRLNISIEYRKSYADEIFANAAKEFAVYMSSHERNQLGTIRQLARELGPDDSRVRAV